MSVVFQFWKAIGGLLEERLGGSMGILGRPWGPEGGGGGATIHLLSLDVRSVFWEGPASPSGLA